MAKGGVCWKTGKPHSWREIPRKSIRQRWSRKYPNRVVVTDRLFECADCHMRYALWRYG